MYMQCSSYNMECIMLNRHTSRTLHRDIYGPGGDTALLQNQELDGRAGTCMPPVY